VGRVGRSSVTIEQAIFQDGACVATAETVVVHMDEATRRSRPLSEPTAGRLRSLLQPAD
jgi:acyl-CoA thioester hydrolase